MADDQKHAVDPDWVDSLTKVAGALGFNEVRVRWKLEGLRKRFRAAQFRAGEQVEHVRYEHKICPSCGRLNDRDADRCVRCEAPLGAHGWHVLQRLGLSLPSILSVSSLLGAAIVIVYGRLLIEVGAGQGILSLDVLTLVRFGGNWPPAVLVHGEWWRLGTAIFLHSGLWHVGFNLLALSMVGPAIEEIFGRGRMLCFFMLTGLLASLGSTLVGGGVSIGASGAVLGLIGLAAGWGHRDGTTIGKQLRGRMITWLVYTMIFGFFIGADHTAHLVGFISGGLIGLVTPPKTLERTQRVPVVVVQSVFGVATALLFITLCLIPPQTAGVAAFEELIQATSRTP
jgi:rhomboid protease GluP